MAKFEVIKLDEVKFYHPAGYATFNGWGIYDIIEGKFVCDAGALFPWCYGKRKIAGEIVDSFNNEGPAGPLSYCERMQEKQTA